MEKLIAHFALLGLFLTTLAGCVVFPDQYQALPPGTWRAVLKLQPDMVTPNPKGKPLPDKLELRYEDVQPFELPFTFEVVYDNDSTFHLVILNGEERLVVPAADIGFGRGPHRARDTLRIDFPVYGSHIQAAYAGHVIEGEWVVHARENYAIPFVAVHGKDYRFTPLRQAPAADISGKWACLFDEGGDPFPAIAEFRQEGNRLSGTFQTETGDFRYLDGTVQGDRFHLSCFDGSHAFLFEGFIRGDSLLEGAFRSGKHYQVTWEGRRDDTFRLAHPDSLTTLLPGTGRLSFTFPNAAGTPVSLDDPAYAGKAKIIQLMGTWCPNCRDESMFLAEYLREHPTLTDRLAVIALAFERKAPAETVALALQRYRERLDLPYEILHAGPSDKAGAAAALPALNRVFAFPTLLFLDRDDRVVRTHTGFYGPATGEYESFKKEFDIFVTSLTGD
jgi:thiol-disulfide isomerase/thioredoxin